MLALREDLDAYVRRFHDKALNSSDLVEEKMLVDVCLLGMMEYRIFIENFSFPFFFKLMEASRRTNESVRPSFVSRSSSISSSRRGPSSRSLKKEKAPSYLKQTNGHKRCANLGSSHTTILPFRCKESCNLYK